MASDPNCPTVRGYYGCDCRGNGPESVSVWTNPDGIITAESYNLSDHKGERSFRGLRRSNPLRAELLALRDKARAKCVTHRNYLLARLRPTEFAELRFAFLVTWGRGGHSIYSDSAPASSSKLSGYGLNESQLSEIDRLGIPLIDSRGVPDTRIYDTVSFPIPPSRPDQFDAAPWGPLSTAPIEVIAGLYASIGATVRNITPAGPDVLSQVRGWNRKESLAYVGWVSNRPDMVGQAMSL